MLHLIYMSKSKRICPFTCREMGPNDVEQANAIEKDAFPDLFPPTSFSKELKRDRATILVAEVNENVTGWQELIPSEHDSISTPNLYRNGYTGYGKGQKFLTGLLIFWEMAGEAHIMSVGVRRGFRRRGVGELLMFNCFSRCVRSAYTAISLEVRSSNKAAQKLYLKHGFLVEGIRKGYYSDNREDALIMNAREIQSPSHIQRMLDRKKTYTELRGDFTESS